MMKIGLSIKDQPDTHCSIVDSQKPDLQNEVNCATIDLQILRIECFAEGATLIANSIWDANHETSLVSANLAVVFEKSGSHIVTATDQIFNNLILHPHGIDAKN